MHTRATGTDVLNFVMYASTLRRDKSPSRTRSALKERSGWPNGVEGLDMGLRTSVVSREEGLLASVHPRV